MIMCSERAGERQIYQSVISCKWFQWNKRCWHEPNCNFQIRIYIQSTKTSYSKMENEKRKTNDNNEGQREKKNTIWKSQFKCSTFFYCFDCVVLDVLFYCFLLLFANDSYCFCCCVLVFCVFLSLFHSISFSFSFPILFYFTDDT